MKLKAAKKHIILPLIFLMIYIFIAAIPLGPDVYCMPLWICSLIPNRAQSAIATFNKETISNIQAAPEEYTGKALKSLITGNRFGYFTEEGALLRSSLITDRATASAKAWTEYTEQAVNTPLYKPNGEKITSIDDAGFVHIDEDRFYLFEPGGNAVAEYDEKGKRLWRQIHTAPITAFNSSPKGSIIGYSDGKLVYIDRAGRTKFDFYPGGSNCQVIFGAALSEQGQYAACVCGLDRQRVLLIRMDHAKHKIVYHAYLTGNIRRQVFVDFDQEDKNVIFECAEGMGFIDCEKLVSTIIPEQGAILSWGTHAYKNMTSVLTQHNNRATIFLIEKPMHLRGKIVFSADNPCLIQEGKHFFLATDTHLARIDIQGIQ